MPVFVDADFETNQANQGNEKHMRVTHVTHVAWSVLLKVPQAIFNQAESKQNSLARSEPRWGIEMIESVTW